MTIAKSLEDTVVNPENSQRGNREWWESNPMTYDWEQTLQIQPGSSDWYQEIDRRFLESAYYAKGPEGTAFGRFLRPESIRGKRVLEIGCGMGTHAEMLVRAGADLTAIDQTGFAVRATKTRLDLLQRGGQVLRQDAENLAFAGNTFDFVWTWGVIHHSTSTERCVGEIARVLRPGGRLMMMVYYRPSLVYYLHCGLIRGVLLGQLLRKPLQKIYVDSSDGFYARVFNKQELRRLVGPYFDDPKITIVGLKAELFPLPRNRFKLMLERCTPEALAGAVLGRFGSMVVIEAVRSDETKINRDGKG
jgi:SAM-dependent methyltransferase